MREAHPLSKRVAETLDLGDEEDLFGSNDGKSPQTRAGLVSSATETDGSQSPSFSEALLGLLGSTTAGSTG